MIPNFKNIPSWVIGVCNVLVAGMIPLASISAISGNGDYAGLFLAIRSMIKEFIAQATGIPQ